MTGLLKEVGGGWEGEVGRGKRRKRTGNLGEERGNMCKRRDWK